LDELINIKEAAAYLRLNYMTVYKLAQKRSIPAFKGGGNCRFKKDILGNWLNAQANTNIGSVLIVDDDPMISDVLRNIVQEQHHSVTVAANGKVALEAVGKQHYDLIFLDVMVISVGGTKVLESIKEKDRNAVVVVMTDHAHESVALKAMATGPLMLVHKPFNEKDIISILGIVIKPKGD
jgi:excisionase family DNA binding protein